MIREMREMRCDKYSDEVGRKDRWNRYMQQMRYRWDRD